MLLFQGLFIKVVDYTFSLIQNKNTGRTVFLRIGYRIGDTRLQETTGLVYYFGPFPGAFEGETDIISD